MKVKLGRPIICVVGLGYVGLALAVGTSVYGLTVESQPLDLFQESPALRALGR